jgi:hypothetical protein
MVRNDQFGRDMLQLVARAPIVAIVAIKLTDPRRVKWRLSNDEAWSSFARTDSRGRLSLHEHLRPAWAGRLCRLQ